MAILDAAFAAIATATANAERNLVNARGVFESDVAIRYLNNKTDRLELRSVFDDFV